MTDPKKRDILADLLGGGQRNAPETAAIEQIIRGQGARLAAQERLEKRPELRTAKVKTTYYLAEEVYENLEDARQTLADLMPAELRHKITRSLVVELALTLVLRDFEKRGKDGALFQRLLRELKHDPKK